MTDDERAVIFERFLDNVELYLDTKKDLKRRREAVYASEPSIEDLVSLEEERRETLDILRELARKALDEYVLSS